MTTVLSERRASDRKTMAAALETLILECGATFERLEGPGFASPHEIMLEVTAPGGLRVPIELDGKSPQPDVHVLTWHMHYDSKKRLNGAVFGGGVNPHHFRKATYVAYGFKDLCAQLRSALLMCKDGTAYLADEPSREAAVPA
jgi:hypothetical protein